MILVDSSVWIDFFRGAPTPAAARLDDLLTSEVVVMGDLMLTEVLQGFGSETDFERARRELARLDCIEIVGRDCAIAAARNYRTLRQRGVTVRKTIDCLIATRCLIDGYPLLYGDRDFDPFVEHLGLQSAI